MANIGAVFLYRKTMELQTIEIGRLRPYKKNPRKNEGAIDYVADSIKAFGFKVPIVIDKNYTIVCGHTRYKAAKKLKMTEVPCIMADDLTDEQIKAFRLADNKVAEKADWDFELLDSELDEILNIDMEALGFEFEEDDYTVEVEDDGYYGDERERTNNRYNLQFFDPSRAEGFYQMPILRPTMVVPSDIISFNYMLTEENKKQGIHFYCDDYQFERIWDRPEFYIEKLKEFECAFTPDFSLYMDMPLSMKIWNVYRSRLIGQMMQDAGMQVIPTVSWAEPDTFEFCFDGLPEEATLSVSTIGVKKDEYALWIWSQGMNEMIKRLKPKRLLIYGGKLDYDFDEAVEVIYYDNKTTRRMSSSG